MAVPIIQVAPDSCSRLQSLAPQRDGRHQIGRVATLVTSPSVQETIAAALDGVWLSMKPFPSQRTLRKLMEDQLPSCQRECSAERTSNSSLSSAESSAPRPTCAADFASRRIPAVPHWLRVFQAAGRCHHGRPRRPQADPPALIAQPGAAAKYTLGLASCRAHQRHPAGPG